MAEETYNLTAMSRSELEAEIVHQAKLINRFRKNLGTIVIGLEDEGDRVFLGSTNDADWLRQIEGDMLGSLEGIEMPWMHGRDLYADLANLRGEVIAKDAEIARLLKHIRHMANWITRANKGVRQGPYSFEGLGEDLAGLIGVAE